VKEIAVLALVPLAWRAVRRRDLREAALVGSAVLPYAAWCTWVRFRIGTLPFLAHTESRRGALGFPFAGIRYTTVTKSNILNLTYPVFVFLAAPYIAAEKQKLQHVAFLAVAMIGAGLVVTGGTNGIDLGGINIGDVLSLLSGVVAGFAISGLREARKHDSSPVILFYQMGFGTVVTLLWMLPSFAMPRGWGLAHTLLAAAASNAGQYFLTEGYRHISASLGAIVLESGILFAALLGISLFHDPLTPPIIAGGVLILGSIAGVSGIFGRPGGKNGIKKVE
jgi:drug/metabolite transporter (DMT)-like permease